METIDEKVTQESLGKLDQKEVELIHHIRTRFRYGEISIECRDGKPYRVKKAVEYQILG